MKKIFSFISVAFIAIMALTSCKEKPSIIWNLEAQAAGEGKITVTYPTGNPGLVVEGIATATATTTNDTTATAFMVPNGGLLATDVLASPSNYSKQQVKDAEALVEANKAVDFKAEGTWHAYVKGYAKYHELYFVINEEWPTDTTKVIMPALD